MVYQFDSKAAVEYGNLVNFAYSMYGRATSATDCTPSYDGLLDQYDFAAWVRMNDFTPQGKAIPQFYGIIVQRKNDPNTFILAIRGTENVTEWWDDFTSIVPKAMGGFAGKVGDGFGTIFGSMEVLDSNGNPTTEFGQGFVQQVAAAVTRKLLGDRVTKGGQEQLSAQGRVTMEVTGHSLGSALATLYVAKNASDQQLRISRVYTFASPFVGDSDFAASYNALGIETWRIADFWDRVPHLPDRLEFKHVNQAHPINSWFEVHADVICWHSMQTYLHVIDPTIPIDPSCAPLQPDPHYIAGH
jgi:triacylglycerol lipase